MRVLSAIGGVEMETSQWLLYAANAEDSLSPKLSSTVPQNQTMKILFEYQKGSSLNVFFFFFEKKNTVT